VQRSLSLMRGARRERRNSGSLRRQSKSEQGGRRTGQSRRKVGNGLKAAAPWYSLLISFKTVLNMKLAECITFPTLNQGYSTFLSVFDI